VVEVRAEGRLPRRVRARNGESPTGGCREPVGCLYLTATSLLKKADKTRGGRDEHIRLPLLAYNTRETGGEVFGSSVVLPLAVWSILVSGQLGQVGNAAIHGRLAGVAIHGLPKP
jgi:hypothetical protein